MLEPTTVWMVVLRRGDVAERKGLLSLEPDGLAFRDVERDEVRLFKFDEVRRARRVRGSPILIVRHANEGDVGNTAFYFTQPPPLSPPGPGERPSPAAVTTPRGRPLGAFSAIRRTSRRRHMRENVRYLTTMSGSKKQEIEAWVNEIAARTGR